MEYAILLLAAISPPVLLIWYFHWRDVYPEPRRVLWVTFSLGMLTVVPVLMVGGPIFYLGEQISDPYLNGLILAFFGAGIPEEFFKFLVVILYCSRHKEFNEPMDGMVYGVTASLGFATLENLIYMLQVGLPGTLLRAITAIPMHAMLGAVMGYYIGQWRFHHTRSSGFLIKALILPMLLHGLYDFPLLTLRAFGLNHQEPSPEETLLLIGLLLIPVSVLAGQLIWVLVTNHRLRRHQHGLKSLGAPEGTQDVMPME